MTVTWQQGITSRPPGHVHLAALAFVHRDGDAARLALESLRTVLERELGSDLDELTPLSPKDLPPAETGELGFEDDYYRAFLTITLGISATGFEALGIPAADRPADLIPIPWTGLGDSPRDPESGDLILQVCGDNVYVLEHVLRRVEEELSDLLQVIWTISGAQRYTTTAGRTSRREGRALIGFLDGTSNLHPRDVDEDRRLVFVEPARVSEYPPLPQVGPGDPYGQQASFPPDLRPPPATEPDWTKLGTYMVVRASLIRTSDWDSHTLGEQESTVGRFKHSGASLDLTDDPALLEAEPAFAQNQADERVAVDSHVRKTNPRRAPEDPDRRLFRRGYPLIQTTLEGVQRGLVFISFARTISTQFEFIMRAWIRNPHFPRQNAGVDRLFAFEEVLCGGYYFVPPLEFKTKPWSWMVPGQAEGTT